MNDTTTPRPTLDEAAYELWKLFFRSRPDEHPYAACIAVCADAIQVIIDRRPLRDEQQIPAEWMGWPVVTLESLDEDTIRFYALGKPSPAPLG